MKIFKTLLLILIINLSSCINFESNTNQKDLSEALRLNDNKEIINKIGINEKIKFSYTTTVKKKLFESIMTNYLIAEVVLDKNNNKINSQKFKSINEKIKKVLKEEMKTYYNFDKIELKLTSNGELLEKYTLEI
jgi:Fe-S cluster biosynthesis and repair protein YggX